MLIESIDVFHVATPLVRPFNTAFGDTFGVESILVRLRAEGVTGWGEAAPWAMPLYSAEWAGGCFATAREHLAPRLLGQRIASGAELQERLGPLKGNYFAKAAFDLAWWDAHARQRNEPLWKTLGGAGPEIQVGADFGVVDTTDELLHLIDGALSNGFPRVKLKIRRGWDVDVLRLVRAAFPEGVFHVDANSGYTLEDAPVFEAMDELGLAMIEQPLMHDDIVDHAALQKRLRTPICLDESITSPRRATQAAEIGACGWINIKPGRLGGLTPSLEVLRAAAAAGIPCWIGGMLESAIGASHCTALATLDNIRYPSDIFPSDRFFKRDLANRAMHLHASGKIAAFAGPGIGCEPDAARLKTWSRAHWHGRASKIH